MKVFEGGYDTLYLVNDRDAIFLVIKFNHFNKNKRKVYQKDLIQYINKNPFKYTENILI